LIKGIWQIHANGYNGELNIMSLDFNGVISGKMEIINEPSHDIAGEYNDSTGKIKFQRIMNQAKYQTYEGYSFKEASFGSPGKPDAMAGHFLDGSEKAGWYAIKINKK
jgi:hypothetical protein